MVCCDRACGDIPAVITVGVVGRLATQVVAAAANDKDKNLNEASKAFVLYDWKPT